MGQTKTMDDNKLVKTDASDEITKENKSVVSADDKEDKVEGISGNKTETIAEDKPEKKTGDQSEEKSEKKTEEKSELDSGDKAEDNTESESDKESIDSTADKSEAKTVNEVEEKSTKDADVEPEEKLTNDVNEEPEIKTKDADDKSHKELEDDKPYVDTAAFESVKKKKHIMRWIMTGLAGLIVIFYFVMVYLSHKYFAPGTRINGQDYSFRSYEDVLNDVNSKYEGYVLRIRYRNGEDLFNKDEAGLIVTAEKDVKKIKKKQNPFLWFTYLWSDDNTVEFEFDCDKEVLMKSIENSEFLDPEKMISPEEPTLEFNKRTGHVEVIEGDDGTQLDKFAVFLICYDAVKNVEGYVDIKNSDCYIEPQYYADSPRIVNTVNRINHYLDAKVTYLYGSIRIELSPENIYNILDISDDYSVYLSKQKVRSFIERISDDYDTYGKERNFRTHDGKLFKVNSDEYGYQIDIDKEADLLYIAISSGETIEREPEFIHKGYSYDKPHDDLGKNYAEVNLTKQKVYLYIDGKVILESDCVSGNMSEEHGTPSGLYDLDGMYYKVVLTGPDYASPVTYWMPFNDDIGFHDATWRSYFGGDIYMTNGSHGCVNLPFETAEQIYNTIEPGFPVILYWEEELSR